MNPESSNWPDPDILGKLSSDAVCFHSRTSFLSGHQLMRRTGQSLVVLSLDNVTRVKESVPSSLVAQGLVSSP